jgi:hypothetical protein
MTSTLQTLPNPESLDAARIAAIMQAPIPSAPSDRLARELTRRVQQVQGKKKRRTAIWGSTPVESIYIPGNWALFAEVINTNANDLGVGPVSNIEPRNFAKKHGCTYTMVYIGAAIEGLLTIADIFPALVTFGRGHTGRGVDACIARAPDLAGCVMNPHAANFFAVFNPDETLPRSVEVCTVTVNVIKTAPGAGPSYIFVA